jgi:DNA-binding transcriptional ArsR family regulator
MTPGTRPARRRGLSDAAPVFAALGDPVRLQIIARLCQQGPLPVVRLAEDSGISRQAVSKHLATLAHAGLVEGQRRGREHVWRLRPRSLDRARRHLDAIEARWDDALARLQAMVETPSA